MADETQVQTQESQLRTFFSNARVDYDQFSKIAGSEATRKFLERLVVFEEAGSEIVEATRKSSTYQFAGTRLAHLKCIKDSVYTELFPKIVELGGKTVKTIGEYVLGRYENFEEQCIEVLEERRRG